MVADPPLVRDAGPAPRGGARPRVGGRLPRARRARRHDVLGADRRDALSRTLRGAGATRLLVLPLYPQYSVTTTRGSFTRASRALAEMGWAPECRRAPDAWYDEPGFVAAHVDRILAAAALLPDPRSRRRRWSSIRRTRCPSRPSTKEKDPYPRHIEETVRLIDAALGNRYRSRLGYQSKVGPVEWLGPSTPDVLADLAKAGEKQVLVVPVAFVSDHVETLYEIRLLFGERGGAPRHPALRRRRRPQRPPGVHPQPRRHREKGRRVTRVVILGGGIAGLSAAFRRASAGETIVLEAGPQAGGSIRTIREDGFTLECGPNTLRTTEAAERLLADLGLEPRAVKADGKAPRWIVRGGSPRAVVPGPAALFNTVFTLKGKLRLLKEPFVAPRPASLEDESVHSFFARRFGEEAALYGAGPMVSGVYAGDPRSLSMRSAFPRLWEAEGAVGKRHQGIFLEEREKELEPQARRASGGAAKSC